MLTLKSYSWAEQVSGVSYWSLTKHYRLHTQHYWGKINGRAISKGNIAWNKSWGNQLHISDVFFFYRYTWYTMVYIPPSGSCWDSVANIMYGSCMIKRAQDLALKFIPWKQAKVRFLPFKDILPPRMVPCLGIMLGSIENRHPTTSSRALCQCRWCRMSQIPSKEKDWHGLWFIHLSC